MVRSTETCSNDNESSRLVFDCDTSFVFSVTLHNAMNENKIVR